MKYRICYCPDCGKVSEYGLGVKNKCSCGNDNYKAWKVEEKEYSCIQIDRKIEEIFGEDN
jgi:hypothetical protein